MWAVILYNTTHDSRDILNEDCCLKKRIVTLASRYIPQEWDFSKVRAKAPTLLESPMGLG